MIETTRRASRDWGFHFIDYDDPRQGIAHVVAPELGIAFPGATLVCCDSHTSTVGGVGALAWGIGASEAEHVLATQTLVQSRAEDDARDLRRAAGRRRRRQGHDPGADRPHRRPGRHRLRDRVRRLGDPRHADRGPADDLQHVGRVLLQGRLRHRPTTARSSTSRAASSRPRALPGTLQSPTGAACTATTRPHSTAKCRSTATPWRRRSPGGSARSRWWRSTTWYPIRPRLTTAKRASWRRERWLICGCSPAHRSRASRSTSPTSAPVPTPGCRTFGRPLPCCAGARSSRACRQSAYRDRPASSAPPRPRVWTASFARRASSGSNRRVAGAEHGRHPIRRPARHQHHQPQLRGSTGSADADPSREPVHGGRQRRGRLHQPTRGGFSDGSIAPGDRCRRADAADQHRHRPDHPGDVFSAAPMRRAMARTCSMASASSPTAAPNPEFILNQPPYDHAQILLADRNFGCGSSRERAPKALREFGFRAVIAPSFGGIFFNNCFRNGIVPVELPIEDVRLMAAEVEASRRRRTGDGRPRVADGDIAPRRAVSRSPARDPAADAAAWAWTRSR